MGSDHESGLRRMIAGDSYHALPSLTDAKAKTESAVVMQGDDGGSIYLTCPARVVECDEGALGRLVLDLDAHMWNDPERAGATTSLHR